MPTNTNDLYRDLSSPSRGRDALLRAVGRGKISRLLDHLERCPTEWGLVEMHAGAVLEALIERQDLDSHSEEVRRLLSRMNPAKLLVKTREIAERGQLDWALQIVTIVLQSHPQADGSWWRLLAQIHAGLKRSEEEHQALLKALEHGAEPSSQLEIADRLLGIDAWRDAFQVLSRLYALPAWRGIVVRLLAKALLTDGRWQAADWSMEWDRYWHPVLDATARTEMWSEMLRLAREQVSYDRNALADGIDAMQACLNAIAGRDLQADIEHAQDGHQLALKLMRFVRSLEPLDRDEQPLYMMLLDLLVAWETRWKERGIKLEYAMEKDLGSVWVDEQVFASALEVLSEQFASQLTAPTRALLQVRRDEHRQAVNIVLQPTGPDKCVPRHPLAAIDTAFLDRVMRGHSCQWRYEGENGCNLAVSIPTVEPSADEAPFSEEQVHEWLRSWQVGGQEGLARLQQQGTMIREPLRFGVSLTLALKNSVIADWAEEIRVIVHDLKNLFTFLQQWITQALSDPYSWSMAMERIAEIKARMQETLSAIRELAVLSGPAVCEPIVVVDLIRRVISNSRAFLEAHGVVCKIAQKTSRGEIWADSERLASVVTNLLKNGVEAMPDGGQVTISIDRTEQAQVRLMIEDTGIGISPDELPRLFAMGKTTKPGGSGIGLPAVARTLSSMGAEIEVDSVPGLGSRFVITFPRSAEDPAEDPRALPMPKEQQTRMTQQALRAAAALYTSGDLKMTAHLWHKALIGQLEPPLRRRLSPMRARQLLASLTTETKRGCQLNDEQRARLRSELGCPSKQLAKKGTTVVQALISGAWDRLTHPLHWAILLRLFRGRDAYPWPDELCAQMAQWLVAADAIGDADEPLPNEVAALGSKLGLLLELALPGHLGA